MFKVFKRIHTQCAPRATPWCANFCTSDPAYPRYMNMIGNTQMIDLTALANPRVAGVQVLAKTEFLNPGHSHKDRFVWHLLQKLQSEQKLKPGDTLVSASSGNTGCSLAMIGAMLGYNVKILTNSKCSIEKVAAIRAFGAEVIIVDQNTDYMEEEIRLANENPSWISIDQYNNPENPGAHYRSLGPEIWSQTKGSITEFVMGGSTGGTITGVGRFLKEQNPNIHITLADPIGSNLHHYFHTREIRAPMKFLVEGVGKENIPGALDISVVDDTMQIADEDAFQMCHLLATREGLCVGGSAGMNVRAAVNIANEATEPKVIVTILCDLGVKYLSKIYNDEYLRENGISLDKSPKIE